jgi:starch phosphorylase
MFYQRDPSGVPVAWIERVRASMSRLTPQFSSNRAVREYADKHYIGCAKTYAYRSQNLAAVADLVRWRAQIEDQWPRLRFGSVDVASHEGRHEFTMQIYLDGLNAEAVRVQLYAAPKDSSEEQVVEMQRCDPLVGAANAYCYTASVPTTRPAGDFTPRIVPYHPLAAVPLECARILWYK